MSMSFTRYARAIPALLLIVACTPSSDDTIAETADTIPVISVTATDQTYEAPDTVSAGFNVLRLVNRGERLHTATVVRLEEGRSLPEYLRVPRSESHPRRPTDLGDVPWRRQRRRQRPRARRIQRHRPDGAGNPRPGLLRAR